MKCEWCGEYTPQHSENGLKRCRSRLAQHKSDRLTDSELRQYLYDRGFTEHYIEGFFAGRDYQLIGIKP